MSVMKSVESLGRVEPLAVFVSATFGLEAGLGAGLEVGYGVHRLLRCCRRDLDETLLVENV